MDKKTVLSHLTKLPQTLSDIYELKMNNLENSEGNWFLENGDSKVEIKSIEGDYARFRQAIEWQRFLSEEKKTIVPELVRTKNKQDYAEIEGRLYFVIIASEKGEFKPENPTHLLKAAKSLGVLHRLSAGFILPIMHGKEEMLTPGKIQEGLADLIRYYNRFKRQRSNSDFERIYTENFSFFYDQGQETLERMVMSGYNIRLQKDRQMLVNSFLKNNLAIVDNSAIFTELGNWTMGTKTMDFALLLNSYLPLYKWDPALMKQLLDCYEKESGLDQEDRQMLLAFLRFPYRFWFYVCQYQQGMRNVSVLTKKLRNYIYESSLRDYCLDQMEGWLWREENENSGR